MKRGKVEHVQVLKEGSTLRIGLKPGTSYNLRDATLEAGVIMPELASADLSGGSHLRGKIDAGSVALVAVPASSRSEGNGGRDDCSKCC